ncbi:MAG: TPMT family class I SAM-dependent methyltransferase [Lentisphaerales bacterium]|nr:TPMT family class I SAM-dependent methyltransferase [Lentisphaerales bacterium]
MKIDGTDDPNSWEKIYQTNDAGWDIGKPAPPFVSLLERPPSWLSQGKIAAFGAGLGHDAVYFAKNGFAVTAIDFAPSAVKGIKKYSDSNDKLTPFLGDILNLPDDFESSFDYVLEHTCFCAIPPENRPKYVESVKSILKPDGILFGLFYRFDPADDKGPPHATSEEEVKELFEKDFEILDWHTPNNSHGRRKTRERFIAFKVKK